MLFLSSAHTEATSDMNIALCPQKMSPARRAKTLISLRAIKHQTDGLNYVALSSAMEAQQLRALGLLRKYTMNPIEMQMYGSDI